MPISAAHSHIALLCNDKAGNGLAVRVTSQLETLLHRYRIPHTVFIDKWPPSFQGFTDVFIIGGDGTMNYFINQYPDFNLPLVLFKGGTGNDFHWLLYGKITLKAQFELVLQQTPGPVDCGVCNGRLFINGVGAGFEGAVAKALQGATKIPGKTSYLITVLKKIFTYRSAEYTINADGEEFNGKKLLIDICNGKRAGGGFHVSPEADPDDGYLDLVLADALTPLQRIRYLPVIENGKHLGLKFIQHRKIKKVVIHTGSLFPYHLDGEFGEAQQLEISIREKAFLFRFDPLS